MSMRLPVAAELVLGDVAAQAHPAVAAIERAALRAAAPASGMGRRMRRARLGAVALEALVLAMARRTAGDAAARVAGVEVGARAGARPPGRVKRALGVDRVELGIAARAEAGALVAGDAERLRAVAGRAVGLAAPHIDG